MNTTPSNNPKAKTDKCAECNYNFTQKSHRYYCCDQNVLVCQLCSPKKQCKTCQKLRSNKLVKCAICKHSNGQPDVFYDFKMQSYFCPKCIANSYIHGYEHMIRANADPKEIMINWSGKSQYCIEDLIHFFKRWCFCCLKQFNKNAYQMKHGARICELCLQANFDLALPKLIMCVECNGYIRDSNQIKLEITKTQVICTYCSVKQLNNYDTHKIKEASKASRISRKESGFIIPASEMSKIKEKNMGGQVQENLPAVMRSKMVKVISRNSTDEESLNYMLYVDKPKCNLSCALCNSYHSLSGFFQLTPQEIDRLGLTKQLQAKKISNKVCLMCFNQNSHLFQVKRVDKGQFQPLLNFSSNRQLTTIRLNQPPSVLTFQSSQDLPRSPRSPRAKIFQAQAKIQRNSLCEICKKIYGSIKVDDHTYCQMCSRMAIKTKSNG